MATTPTPVPDSGVTQRYQPPQGAIPIEKIKRVLIGVGVLLLVALTLYGIFHKPAVETAARKPSTVQPTTPGEIDSQQAELQREMQEATRAAQEAELAKQRAEHYAGEVGDAGPRNARAADQTTQLLSQLRLEDLRRQHQAAYASNVAYAPQAGRGESASSTAPTLALASLLPATQASTVNATLTDMAGDRPATSAEMQPAALPPGTYRLDEGTVIETILLNRLDREFVGPVITQVSTAVYSRAGIELLIPKGSRLLGEAKAVSSTDQRRLAILFHRLILPKGKYISLDKFRGLDQIGETGVVSKIDHHYLEIFGTSLALGAIRGLMEIGAYSGYGYDAASGRTGFTERMGSSAEEVLSKYLNKMPTIKVLEGARIKVILTNDLTLEAYE
jgi:type IV secretion system protein VirB10